MAVNNFENILLVNTDVDTTRNILELLAQKGLQGIIAKNQRQAIETLENNSCCLVFIDARTSSTKTNSTLKHITGNYPEMPIVMTGGSEESNYDIVEKAVHAIRQGCCDFLTKPLDRQKVSDILDAYAPDKSSSSADSIEFGNIPGQKAYKIVGKSAALTQTLQMAKKIAATSIPVLLSGESGTGKELIAYFVHQKSKRAGSPYVKINCASLNESLLESELFGHERGAFTGAHDRRIGRFEMAHGGTLLLDEIPETPLTFQAKLLRVLEQQDFERVGGNENVRVNVRIISTTNRNLLEQVKKGLFRADLYYRLSGVRIIVPSLKERPEDLHGLVWNFVHSYAKEAGRCITNLDPKMMGIFAKYHWPGNIRELKNVVLTSLVLGSGQTLCLADVSWLFDEILPLSTQTNNDTYGQENAGLAGLPLERVERRAILDTLGQTDGNQAKAARILGISDRTLRDKMKKYRQQEHVKI